MAKILQAKDIRFSLLSKHMISFIKKEKVFHSMIEIEREFYPDTFNERKKRIEKIAKEVQQMRNGKEL